MEKDSLLEILKTYKKIDEKNTAYHSFLKEDVTLEKIKLSLLGYATVEIENKSDNYIVLSISKGLAGFAASIVVINISNNYINILSYAKEGLLKQNTAQKNMDKIVSLINGEKIKKFRNVKMLLIISVAIIASLLISKNRNLKVDLAPSIKDDNEVVVEQQDTTNDPERCKNIKVLINNYNNVATNLNNIAEAYNTDVNTVSIKNIKELPEHIQPVGLIEASLSLSYEQIENDLKELLLDLDFAIRDYAILIKLIDLTEVDVQNSLSKIDEIAEFKSVTEEKDPNDLLGKDGGYTSCTYFILDNINSASISGTDAVEKGTDAGGCVELYATVEDAIARCEYLAQFDNTLLYSGSYTLVGKSVIRTSYLLSNQEQIDLTESIVDNLITLN